MLEEKMSPFALQAMPPRAARFCLGMERFCRDELGVPLEGASLVVAYSGGADSKALLLALHALATRHALTLHVAILDHCLRKESAGEVAEAGALCSTLGVPFYSGIADVSVRAQKRGIGLEEAGREARLAFLEEVRHKTGSGWIAFGHHLNDLAEDSLMRLLRGSGWPALSGMAGVSRERRVLRPLLLTPRRDIEVFLEDLGVDWVKDSMNEDSAYLRNRIRADMVPLFERENPAFLDTVAQRWRMARMDAAFYEEMKIGLSALNSEEGTYLAGAALECAPVAIRFRKYMDILASLGPGEVAATQLQALDAAWRRGEGGKTVQFPGGKRAAVRQGGILFFLLSQ